MDEESEVKLDEFPEGGPYLGNEGVERRGSAPDEALETPGSNVGAGGAEISGKPVGTGIAATDEVISTTEKRRRSGETDAPPQELKRVMMDDELEARLAGQAAKIDELMTQVNELTNKCTKLMEREKDVKEVNKMLTRQIQEMQVERAAAKKGEYDKMKGQRAQQQQQKVAHQPQEQAQQQRVAHRPQQQQQQGGDGFIPVGRGGKARRDMAAPGPSSASSSNAASQQEDQPEVVVPKVKIPKVANVYVALGVKELNEKLSKVDGVAGHGNYLLSAVAGGRVSVKAKTAELSAKIKSVLVEENVGHFSFPNKGDAPFKAVLYGFSEYPEETVRQWLTDCEELAVKPTAVARMKKFCHKQQKKVNTSFFTVSFPPGTRMEQLKGLKHLHNVAGGFRQLYRTSRLPYCSNCGEDGHVAQGCNMPPNCGKCGAQHQSRECTYIAVDAPRETLHCFRCGEKGHPASYMKCPARAPYFERMRAAKEKQQQQQQQKQQHQRGPQKQNNSSRLTAQQRAYGLQQGPAFVQQQPKVAGAWGNPGGPQQQQQQRPQMQLTQEQIAEMVTILLSCLRPSNV